MKRIKNLVAGAFFAVSTAAAADPMITVQWASNIFSPYSGVGVGTVHYPTNQSVNALAGRFHGSVTATLGIDPAELVHDTTDFFAYCHDLAQLIGSLTEYRVELGASEPMLDWLGAVNYVLNGNMNGGDPFAWLYPDDKQTAAAIQLGIWEALHEDNFDPLTGAVRFTAVPGGVGSVSEHYQAFASARQAPTTDNLDGIYVMRLINGRNQDVITGRRPPSLVIPEPSSLALVGIAVVAAALSRRRRD